MPVSCFGLLHANENIRGIVKVVLVQGVVLGSGAVQPSSRGSFHEESPAYGDVLTVAAVYIVVGCPTPHVLDVG